MLAFLDGAYRMLITFLLNLISFFFYSLGHRGISVFATILGILSFDILRIRRKVILKNLSIAFGEEKTLEEKIKLGRKSTINFFRTAIELLAANKLFKKTNYVFKNKEYMDELLARGQGVYAICIHMGNWEYLCHISAKNLVPIHVVVKPIGKGNLAKWFENMRSEVGFHLIERNGNLSTTTQIFNALNKKEIIGFIVDQKRPRGEMLPFFGKNASTNNSLAKLWLRRNAPVIPAIIKRVNVNTHEIIFFPEFQMNEDKSKSFQENVTENTTRINAQVEQMIRLNPEEYFWMHNRWG